MKARGEKKKHCQSCNTKFGLTTHKHSCKRCHSIICSECSKQKIQIVQYVDKKPHKICLNCSDDHQHNTNLKVTGKLQWGVDSNIMKQWIKNINSIDKDLQQQYEDILQKSSPLIEQTEFQEYLTNIEQQISSGNSMKHFNSSYLEMVYSVWGSEIDIHKIRQQIINVIKAFLIDFPDQESPLAYKQEYVDLSIFLLLFGQESSAWRMMKEIYGIIIPIESISHITNNDFNYGEKYLMNFLLDKINYEFNSQECNNIYRFIQDRGIELINSFFTNQTNFQTSYQIFNHVINMPYNRRWSELLRSLGVFIIENKDVIGQNYEKILWDEMKLELNINTKWKRMKEKMDVYCYFQIADHRQMSRFSMVEDFAQSEMDQLQPATDDIIEENKMLKKEVFQIFKVKQLIAQKMDEIDEMRMELQKRELIRQKYEDNLKKFNELQQQYEVVRSHYSELQQNNNILQERLMRFSAQHDNPVNQYDDTKRTTSLIYPLPASQNIQINNQNLHEDEFLQRILKDQEQNQTKINSDKTSLKPAVSLAPPSDISIKQTSSQIEENSQNRDSQNRSSTESQGNESKTEKNEIQTNNKVQQDNVKIILLQKEIDDLEKKNKSYLSQFKTQGDQILKQKLELQKKENEIELLKLSLAKEKADHLASQEQHEKQMADQKSEFERIIEKLKDENNVAQIEQNFKIEIAQSKEKIEQLNLYNQILQSEKTELFLSKQNLVQQVNSLQQSNTNGNANNDNKQEIDHLRNTVTKLELELNSFKENNVKLEKRLSLDQGRDTMITALQEKNKILQQEISELHSQNQKNAKHSSDSTNHSDLSTQESTNKSPSLNPEKHEIRQGETE